MIWDENEASLYCCWATRSGSDQTPSLGALVTIAEEDRQKEELQNPRCCRSAICCKLVLKMFKNTFQSGFLSILYSIGSKPLQIWEKKVRKFMLNLCDKTQLPASAMLRLWPLPLLSEVFPCCIWKDVGSQLRIYHFYSINYRLPTCTFELKLLVTPEVIAEQNETCLSRREEPH